MEQSTSKSDKQKSRVNALKPLALQRRLDALFRALSSDFLLREQFVTNPAQITSEYVLGEQIGEEAVANLNYAIYNCLTTPRLIQWFNLYALQRQESNEPLTITEFTRDFARALVQTKTYGMVEALTSIALDSKASLQISDQWLQVIFGPWQVSSSLNESLEKPNPLTLTASTQQTQQTDTTEIFRSGTDFIELSEAQTLTDVTWKTYTTDKTDKTNVTTPTTRDPTTTETTDKKIDGRFFGMSHVILVMEELTNYARQLEKSGQLIAPWKQ